MGIKTGGGQGNVRFFNINMKEGCLTEGSGESKIKYEPGRAAIEGVPYRLAISEDEYEGQKSMKANLYLRDTEPGAPNMCVSWTIYTQANEASSQGLKLLACIFAADTTKPVSIKPWFAEKGLTLGNVTFDADGGHISVKQIDGAGAQPLKPDYAGRGDQLPKMEDRKVEGTNKVVKVKPGWNEIMEELVQRLSQRLDAENPRNGQSQAAAPAANDGHDIDPAELAGAVSERVAMGARG